ncbi:hypothetical protein FCV25MIE_03519 [Fagus crenata]
MTTVRRLLCYHPDSEEQIDFEVLPGIDHNIPVYYLESHPQINHSAIDRLNIREVSILTHNKYNFTLNEWLDENPNNWSPIYQNWDVNRPTEEARQLIQCILVAVYNLHSKGICHGFLDNPENYFIQCEEPNHEGHEKIKLVHLIHEIRIPNIFERQQLQREDMLALREVIFEGILRGSNEYPEDLSNLFSLLSHDTNFQNWALIVDHPSLWHWKLRFGYIERVWMQFKHANWRLKHDMQMYLNQVPHGYNWINRIPPDTPLERIFWNNHYRQNPVELLRYVRIVRFHYMDTEFDPTGGENFRYINVQEEEEHDYFHEQFIEHVTTKISELLLVYLHRIVCTLGLEI